MPRNLDRRVEVVFPVEDPGIRKAIVSDILPIQLADNVKTRILNSDGTYERRLPEQDKQPLNAQSWLVDNRGIWYHDLR
jgi:polyphosphate kinase